MSTLGYYVSVAALIGLFGSPPLLGQEETVDTHCRAEMECEAEGWLDLGSVGYATSGAEIITQNGCISLLLAPEYYERGQNWERAYVKVSGIAYTTPRGTNILSFEINGRYAHGVPCNSRLLIYVNEVERLTIPPGTESPFEPEIDLPADLRCEIDHRCTTTGRLEIQDVGNPESGVRVVTPDGCTALLVAPEIFDREAMWDGALVDVEGLARRNGVGTPRAVGWYYGDRYGPYGYCESNISIYVIEITRLNPEETFGDYLRYDWGRIEFPRR